jgi:glycosyltransferase involved in cell wall biosynthesis
MKVLFIAPLFPIPAHSGSAIATLETLRSLHSRCQLDVLVPSMQSGHPYDPGVLKSVLPGVAVYSYASRKVQPSRIEMYTTAARTAFTRQSYWALNWINPDLRAVVRRLTRQQRYDVVHCDWLETVVSLRGSDLPLLIRTHDVHFIVMTEWAERLPQEDRVRKSFWRTQAQRFRLFETRTLNSVTAVVTLSSEDEAILRAEGVSNVVTIPPPREVEPATSLVLSRQPLKALFTGRLEMAVNREAFFQFADEIWPQVKPEWAKRVTPIFAGGFPDDQLRRHASECGIEIHAPLDDAEARRLFAEAAIYLSPVVSGTGIKIKTLDAMAHGKSVIGLPGAFRGIPAENGVHAVIANSPKEFARLFEELISNPARQREIGAAAREFIRINFDPASLADRLLQVYVQTAESYQQRRLRKSA